MSDILVPMTEILLTPSQYLKEMNDSNSTFAFQKLS